MVFENKSASGQFVVNPLLDLCIRYMHLGWLSNIKAIEFLMDNIEILTIHWYVMVEDGKPKIYLE